MRVRLRSSIIALFLILILAGCGRVENASRLDWQMGDRVNLAPLSYNVIETGWRTQLGNEFKMRIPEQRYLLITISVPNGGGHDVSLPLLTLEIQDGKIY